jgi:hypothetical protein
MGPERMQSAGQTVIDGALPVGPRGGSALVVGNGNQWDLGVGLQERFQIVPPNHAVERRHSRRPMVAHQGEVDVIAVKMNDIETACVAENQVHQADILPISGTAPPPCGRNRAAGGTTASPAGT